MKKRIPIVPRAVILWGIFILPALFISCGEADRQADDDDVTVAVSILPHAYLVERIGGPSVRVCTLVQPGESPATYQPSDRQVSEVLRSSVYFRTGVPFERGKWLQAITESRSEIRIVDMREGIPLRKFKTPDYGSSNESCGADHKHEGDGASCAHCSDHSGMDPHIWLNPLLLKIQAQIISRTLQEMKPNRAETFQNNCAALLADLDALHKNLQSLLEHCEGSCIYLYHPAWGYFCDAYGLRQVPMELEGKEPSEQELTRFQALARKGGVGVIFVQPQIAGTSIKAVAMTLGAEIRILDPLRKDVLSNLLEAGSAMGEACK